MEFIAKLSPRYLGETGPQRTILIHRQALNSSLLHTKMHFQRVHSGRARVLSPQQGRKQGQSLIEKGRQVAEKKERLKQSYQDLLRKKLKAKPTISPRSHQILSARQRLPLPTESTVVHEPSLAFQPSGHSASKSTQPSELVPCVKASVSRSRAQVYKKMIENRKRV